MCLDSNLKNPQIMKKILFTMAAAGLIGSVQAQDAKEEKPEAGAIGAVVGEARPQNVVKALNDLLIVADGEEVKGAQLETGMDYYLVYHSASW